MDSTIPGEPNAVSYVTDASHRRRLRTVYQENPSTVTEQTWYRWEGSSQVGEYAQGGGSAWDIGTLEKTYLPRLAEVAGDDPTTDTYRYHLTDHLGSVRGIVDGGSKAWLGRNEFTPYGAQRTSAGLPLNKGFTGHTWDPAVGQYFAQFRYYNPGSARWHMRDPIGYAGGWNLYGYVTSNPINGSDPRGLTPACILLPTAPIWEPLLVGGLLIILAQLAPPLLQEIVDSFSDGGDVFPDNPDDLDDKLGPHTKKPDGPRTKGRDKKVWPYGDGEIVHESHPYHPDAPEEHRGPHYHHNTPDGGHDRYMPGDPMPPISTCN